MPVLNIYPILASCTNELLTPIIPVIFLTYSLILVVTTVLPCVYIYTLEVFEAGNILESKEVVFL